MKQSAVSIGIGVLIGAGLILGGLFLYHAARPDEGESGAKDAPMILSFEDCVAAGNAIMESYPQQCKDESGTTFVETLSEEEIVPDAGNVVLSNIVPGQLISSPLILQGKARGWYFEASFPVTIIDEEGNVIAEGYVTALDDWMTEEYVPFSGEILFTPPLYLDEGTLILKKSNPSGLPSLDEQFAIPIRFK